MTPIQIKKGLDIPIAGEPAQEIIELSEPKQIAVYQEFDGLKAKLLVKEGDAVAQGTPLFRDKKRPQLQFCAPAAGTVSAIEYGARRALYRVLIDTGAVDASAPEFKPRHVDDLLGASREDILDGLMASGLLSLFKQRPFSRIPDPETKPRAIHVNGMNTAPFSPALRIALQGQEAAFQAGLNALTRLTEGAVHLSVDETDTELVQNNQNVEKHAFTGPHPAGNSSVHIFHIDPMQPTDVVWTVKAIDVIRMGSLFVHGRYPGKNLITLAGPGVLESERRYYRATIGTPLAELLDSRLEEGEQRIIKGDALSGRAMKPDEHLSAIHSAITVIPEGREQHFMGWLSPGINKLSVSRTHLSGWNGHKRKWKLTTSLNGSYRAMVVTGLYDQYVPLNIMTDFLVRAVLAHDTDEAISLGILETDPEDFALCSYVCPSKMDISGIIRQGLDEIEKEGI